MWHIALKGYFLHHESFINSLGTKPKAVQLEACAMTVNKITINKISNNERAVFFICDGEKSLNNRSILFE